MIAYGLDSTGIETANAQDNAQTAYYLLRSKGLTDRETEVTRLCCQSMTNKEIATQLYISEATVKKHMTHILEKLGLERREQLAEYLTELISPQS
ncbi:MAG: helix-turn-helix transcriptional regulator [Lachnospiraceae bacterium]|nr:helix-turn-helix transcriptional regulator [Lachnospiraceae bacterium]